MDKKLRTRDTDTKPEEPLTQTPTIRDAVTYIVDENGNEIKQQPIVSPESE
jgi:hypothetical protein